MENQKVTGWKLFVYMSIHKRRVGTSLSLWVYKKFRSDPIVPKKAENDDKIGQMKKIETKNYNRLV